MGAKDKVDIPVDLNGTCDLPHVLREVADTIGLATALKLAMDFGGRDIYIPLTLTDHHPLAKSLGHAAAVKLQKLFGEGRLQVPLGNTNYEAAVLAEIDKRIGLGQSESTISRALRVHIRTVRRHRAKLKDTQPLLF